MEHVLAGLHIGCLIQIPTLWVVCMHGESVECLCHRASLCPHLVLVCSIYYQDIIHIFIPM